MNPNLKSSGRPGSTRTCSVRPLVFVILTPSKSSAPTARVPNAISFRRSQDRQARSADLEDYRAFLHGLKAIEVFVSEDHSQAEALTGRVYRRHPGAILLCAA
jgi:hypothetical protein